MSTVLLVVCMMMQYMFLSTYDDNGTAILLNYTPYDKIQPNSQLLIQYCNNNHFIWHCIINCHLIKFHKANSKQPFSRAFSTTKWGFISRRFILDTSNRVTFFAQRAFLAPKSYKANAEMQIYQNVLFLTNCLGKKR